MHSVRSDTPAGTIHPPDAATTPAFGISRVSRFAKAPRALNEPECCSNSNLRSRSPLSPEIPALTFDHRRPADERSDDSLDALYALSIDLGFGHCEQFPEWPDAETSRCF
jgi:hypothetical protein